MENFLRGVNSLRSIFIKVTETGFALVGFIVLVYLLLGEDSGPYVISVIANITLLIGAITPQALVGIAVTLALVHLIRRKS
jgi:Na+(H+)/acetate symporter ActP